MWCNLVVLWEKILSLIDDKYVFVLFDIFGPRPVCSHLCSSAGLSSHDEVSDGEAVHTSHDKGEACTSRWIPLVEKWSLGSGYWSASYLSWKKSDSYLLDVCEECHLLINGLLMVWTRKWYIHLVMKDNSYLSDVSVIPSCIEA